MFYDTSRVRVTYISNQSLDGAPARVLGGVSHVGTWYLAVEAIVGVLGLAVATSLARRGRLAWRGSVGRSGDCGPGHLCAIYEVSAHTYPDPAPPRRRERLQRTDRVMACLPVPRDVRYRYIVIVSREMGGGR
jgi:hypothetical protein